MNTVALLYHDVVRDRNFASSGFPGADADIYKLTEDNFAAHLDRLAALEVNALVTVDDGGVSAIETIAPLLEERKMSGYFFVATDWIDRPGFLSKSQIAELRKRGHLIGSHSCSHPARISHLSPERMQDEWQRSVDILSDILFEFVQMASVPGGFYSPDVARTASLAGVRTLFTSEPTRIVSRVDDCVVVGRYMIQQSTTPEAAAALARGDWFPTTAQAFTWNTKKVLKAVGGPAWLRFRKWSLENTAASRRAG
jgi:peptidoglycan/xylan/chitin deacetylase (PgdA/CDA1 family)